MTGAHLIEPNPTLRIIQVGLSHVDVMAAMHARCFKPGWHAATFSQSLASPGAFALIALMEPEGEPVGFVLARAAGGEAEILSIGVVPAARRGGIGRRLLAAGTARAASTGADALFLEVAEGNEAARRLYEQIGFEIVGRRADYYRHANGIGEAALVMRRELRA